MSKSQYTGFSVLSAPVKLCPSPLSKSKTLAREGTVLSHIFPQPNLLSAVFSEVLDLYSLPSKENLVPAILTPLPVLLLFLEICSLCCAYFMCRSHKWLKKNMVSVLKDGAYQSHAALCTNANRIQRKRHLKDT